MHHLIIALLLASSPTAQPVVTASGGNPGLCYFEGSDVTVETQICFYGCLDGEHAITIDALDICPLNISDAE